MTRTRSTRPITSTAAALRGCRRDLDALASSVEPLLRRALHAIDARPARGETAADTARRIVERASAQRRPAPARAARELRVRQLLAFADLHARLDGELRAIAAGEQAAHAPAEPTRGNVLHHIVPYHDAGAWVFDDPERDLRREPFVAGMDVIMAALARRHRNGRRGFRLYFSTEPFPGHDSRLHWLRAEYGGDWYYHDGLRKEGWLCPALGRYFEAPPGVIYLRSEPFA